MSPTVLREGPYKFFFYADEGHEPKHVHVWSGKGQAKFWLDPVELAKSHGYNNRELNIIAKIIDKNRASLIEAWDDYFGGSDE